MLNRLKVPVLLLGLTLVLLGPSCKASSLGMTVHVTPLDSQGGQKVRALFTAIAVNPCPSLSGLCSPGDDCVLYTTALPFNGTKPGSGWCVRQWEKTVSSTFNGIINIGSNTEIYVSMKADPVIRENNGKLNHPAFVALPPPLRARENCPHHFHLSALDVDGDTVRCRFARSQDKECQDCTQHSFIELDQENCMLTFTGNASAGLYFIYLMAEDLIPVPKTSHVITEPLSSVPVHLSLTVEQSTTSCSDEPVVGGESPGEDAKLDVLPYHQVQFNTDFDSSRERVEEVAVVGPPELYRTGFKSIGSLATMTMAWVRSQNTLPRLLPVCFAANTNNLQSEPRCVWLYQRQMRTLPAGTVLTCEKTLMTLVLPIDSLSNINLSELQLNSPTCPLSYNSTHLTALISLDGCGTKAVQSGSELVFTNTLKSVRPYAVVSRRPSLVLPLACRIPASKVKGPHYEITIPTEKETFGDVRVWIELHMPGEGPLSKFTKNARLRSLLRIQQRARRDVGAPSQSERTTNSSDMGSRISKLDLHVMSNCSIERAEMIVNDCIESETDDFLVSHPLLEQGCTSSDSTLEVVTTQTNSKVYRLDLSSVQTNGTTMYVQCTVNLCITTMPSQKCPDLCSRSTSHRSLLSSLFTGSYTIKSGPVSLVVTTAAPTTTAVITTSTPTPTTTVTTATPTPTPTTTTAAATTPATTATTAATTQSSTTSHAPERTSAMAVGVVLSAIGIFLQIFIMF